MASPRVAPLSAHPINIEPSKVIDPLRFTLG